MRAQINSQTIQLLLQVPVVRALIERVRVQLANGGFHVLHVLAQHGVLFFQLTVVLLQMT